MIKASLPINVKEIAHRDSTINSLFTCERKHDRKREHQRCIYEKIRIMARANEIDVYPGVLARPINNNTRDSITPIVVQCRRENSWVPHSATEILFFIIKKEIEFHAIIRLEKREKVNLAFGESRSRWEIGNTRIRRIACIFVSFNLYPIIQ